MKILSINYTDYVGGAAKAAYRLHKAINKKYENVEHSLLVRLKHTDDPLVKIIGNVHFNQFRIKVGGQLQKLQRSTNINLHTGNWLPSNISNYINKSDADIVHLHWVAGEMISINDLGKINKPIVWTLHDMWPFTGAEHVVASYDLFPRWITGYSCDNRILGDKGLDIDRLVWCRKVKHWINRDRFNIVGPSKWISSCAKSSYLFKNCNVSTIPNCLDVSVFKRIDKLTARGILSLPLDKKIILFGAVGGVKDSNKGFSFLSDALNKLSKEVKTRDEIICVIFGQSRQDNVNFIPFESIWMGHIYDDVTLSLLYNAADVMVVPSVVESFGQTASEAQSCGCPVVAFNTTGLKDIVLDNETGILVSDFDSDALSDAVISILFSDKKTYNRLSENAVERALSLWQEDVVSEQYISIYNSLL